MRKFRGLGLVIFIAVFALATLVVMLLWNSVAVELFNVPEITFWYSAGLIILCKLLFGGFSKGLHGFAHHHHRGNSRKCGGGMRERCRDAKESNDGFDEPMDMLRDMHDRFHSMSVEERREHIRRHMKHGFAPQGQDCKNPGEHGAEKSGQEVNKTDE